MEISTRGVSAVIMYMQFSHPPNPPGLFRPDRIQARRLRETRRTLQTTSNTKMTNFFNLTSEGNYLHNYYHVEISTRGDYAVITAITNMNFSHLHSPARLSIAERTRTRRSGEPLRTPKSCNSKKNTFYCAPKLDAKYTPNYVNVEISTRANFAVIRIITKGTRTLAVRSDVLHRLFERGKKVNAKGDKDEFRVNMHIIRHITREYRVDNYKLLGEMRTSYEPRPLKRIVHIKTYTTYATKWVGTKSTPVNSYGECFYELTKLMGNLCYEILPRKYTAIAYGTVYSEAKKYDREIRLANAAGTNGRSLSNKTNLCLDMVRTMMVNPNGMSFANKLPIRSVILTTITIIKSVLKSGKVQCFSMSRQEIARAVEQIQQAPPTSELEALQAFIKAQNMSGTLHITDALCANFELRNISLQIGQESTSAHNTVVAGPTTTTTATENPGYVTRSELVLHEPVQYQYIYDPVNDVMKRVEKARDKTTDVVTRDQADTISTGKTNSRKQNCRSINVRTKQVYSCIIAGTESNVDTVPVHPEGESWGQNAMRTSPASTHEATETGPRDIGEGRQRGSHGSGTESVPAKLPKHENSRSNSDVSGMFVVRSL